MVVSSTTSGWAGSSQTYSAVEKRKKGDVLRNASAEGSAARARAPTRVLAMVSVGAGGLLGGVRCRCRWSSASSFAMFTGARARSRRPWQPPIGTSHSGSADRGWCCGWCCGGGQTRPGPMTRWCRHGNLAAAASNGGGHGNSLEAPNPPSHQASQLSLVRRTAPLAFPRPDACAWMPVGLRCPRYECNLTHPGRYIF